MFKLLVCGSREIRDKSFVFKYLDHVTSSKDLNEVVIMHGDQKSKDEKTQELYGADYLADCWALERRVARWRYIANWEKYGKSAGPIRNSRMLKDSPDACVGFLGKQAKNRGTLDMLNKCEKKEIPIKKYYI